MKKTTLAVAVSLAAFAAVSYAQDFKGFKGIKEGDWEYKMAMSGMAGMPAGFAMPEIKFTQCITAKDIEGGNFTQKDGKMPDGCSIKNMKMNSAGTGGSWRMECTKDPKMTADVVMTSTGDSFSMKQDITMDQGGQPMKMVNTMTGTYKGPCAPAKK